MEGDWGEGERRKLGNVVVVDGGENRDMPTVFMLDGNDIFRHAMFGAAGWTLYSVECYNVEKDEWVALDGLPRCRARCVGFLICKGELMEFGLMVNLELFLVFFL
ncbi:hypothetical protein MKW92_042315 [Papaver armeniacum]|nr:hypothetical protein MKW92_042315 [Papaver armeniacum]